jgi:hypothetical protein
VAGPAALAASPPTTTPVLPTITRLNHAVPTHLTPTRAARVFVADPKVLDWLSRYPPKPRIDAAYLRGSWNFSIYSGKTEIAIGRVDDNTGRVVFAYTGPQVAWTIARGDQYGLFGGPLVNNHAVWLGFCAVFLLGLVDWRRPVGMRSVDLLVLLSFSVSLWFFRRGDIFTAMPLIYPPLLWLLARSVLVARADRPPRGGASWPTWVLVAATVLLVGVRIGMNVHRSEVIDVGYAGVVGAQRIAHGIDPYGHFPSPKGSICGTSNVFGEIIDHRQKDGRCESVIAHGDTYGPVMYLAYLPGYAAFGWNGKWRNDLTPAHATSILFDLLVLVGLALVGRRFGGWRMAATAAFAWAAWPFTVYALSTNTNDTIVPAILIWGFLALTSAATRGAVVALAGWAKFAPLILAPLWSGYPGALRGRAAVRYAAGFLGVTLLAFSILLFDSNVPHAIRVFYDASIGLQIHRDSPFSVWDWGQYQTGSLPDLHLQQRALQVLLVVAAVALAFVPRRRSPLRMAALTAALLIGFQLVLTHWFYLYLPWLLPFLALALLAPLPGGADEAPDRL